MNCCKNGDFKIIKEYDPIPKNSDGSIRWFLFRWDDGKNGIRQFVSCRSCGALYLAQVYHLHKFCVQKDILFEDYYSVKDEREADHINRTYTGIQLEHHMKPKFQLKKKLV